MILCNFPNFLSANCQGIWSCSGQDTCLSGLRTPAPNGCLTIKRKSQAGMPMEKMLNHRQHCGMLLDEMVPAEGSKQLPLAK